MWPKHVHGAHAGVLVQQQLLPPWPAPCLAVLRWRWRRDLAMMLWAYGAGGADVPEDALQLLLERSAPKLQVGPG